MTTFPHPEPDPRPTDAPAGETLDASLLALRQRLRAAREERGACPPWVELRDDLLPGGRGRQGRTERLAHRELCPYCDAHVREWQQSLDRTSDTLEALEKGVARGVVDGARRLVEISRGAERSSVPREVAAKAEARSADEPPAPTQTPAKPQASPPAPRHAAAAAARPPADVLPSRPHLRLLVVETAHEEREPASVFLCAAVLEAEVACVENIDDLAGDPDLEAVCGVIFAMGRPAADWPDVVRRARDLAPGSPVVILTAAGSAPPARPHPRLGARVLDEADPAEALLMALDAELR
jgi:hypothetical protein